MEDKEFRPHLKGKFSLLSRKSIIFQWKKHKSTGSEKLYEMTCNKCLFCRQKGLVECGSAVIDDNAHAQVSSASFIFHMDMVFLLNWHKYTDWFDSYTIGAPFTKHSYVNLCRNIQVIPSINAKIHSKPYTWRQTMMQSSQCRTFYFCFLCLKSSKRYSIIKKSSMSLVWDMRMTNSSKGSKITNPDYRKRRPI